MITKEIIITISVYNNEQEVVEFVNKIAKQNMGNKIGLFITCNSVNDKKKFEQDINNISVEHYIFYPTSNLGYLNGCLYGVKQYRKIIKCKWIMITNTDITFLNTSFFEKILTYNWNEDFWCIAPDIILPTGRHQNPFLRSRPDKYRIQRWRFLQGNAHILHLYSILSDMKQHVLKHNYNEINRESCEIYAPHGSCFLLSERCIDKLIRESKKVFMYGEEILVGEIIREESKKVYYCNDLKIRHNENATTKYINYEKKADYYKKSFEYIYKRFF